MPWVGAGIGIILGVIIVISDNVLTKAPTLTVSHLLLHEANNWNLITSLYFCVRINSQHPSLMVLMIIVISLIGYGISRGYRYYSKQQRRGLLEPPVDLLDEFKKAEVNGIEPEPENITNRSRYTKAQARQRFKRGKT